MRDYLRWFFTEHIKNGRGKLKLVATIYGVFQIIYATPLVLEEYYGGWIPLLPVIASFIAMWGFLIGIIYQPINIYMKLKRLAARKLEAEKLIIKERKAKVSKTPKKKDVKKKTTTKRAVKNNSKNIKKDTKGLK
jgi:hypothetical protein